MDMKKKYCLGLVVLGLLVGVGLAVYCFVGVKKVRAGELLKMLDDPGVTILDVREDKHWHFSARKIKGAHRAHPEELEAWHSKYPKTNKIVIYCACPADRTSVRLAKELRQMGFENALALAGGWVKWKELGYPVEEK